MLLHISIWLALPSPKWQVKGVADKETENKRKNELRKMFKKEWGMTILTPNKGGTGNTHNGNMARRFFRDK